MERSARTRSLVVLLLLTSPAPAEPIIGRAFVSDGDTLDIRGTRIRLYGIDTPGSGQTCKDAAAKDYRCGQAAALALAGRSRRRPGRADVLQRGRSKGGRVVGRGRQEVLKQKPRKP